MTDHLPRTPWFNCWHERPGRIGHYEVMTINTGKILSMYFGGIWWHTEKPPEHLSQLIDKVMTYDPSNYQWRGLTELYGDI